MTHGGSSPSRLWLHLKTLKVRKPSPASKRILQSIPKKWDAGRLREKTSENTPTASAIPKGTRFRILIY